MPRPHPSRNFRIIDLARSLSILVVLASHFAFFVPEPRSVFSGFWYLLRGQGRAAVTIFFLVSGFLITRIMDQGPGGLFRVSFRWFYVRRIGRILPLFLLQVFAGWLFIAVCGWGLGDHSLEFFRCFKLPRNPWDFRFWCALLTLLPFSWTADFLKETWGGLGLHWSIFWSLAIEEQFYLFYPLSLRFFGNDKSLARALAFLTFLCLAISCAGDWLVRPGAVPVFTWSDIWCYGAIALGAFLYLIDKHRDPSGKRPSVWNLVLTAIGGLVFLAGGSGFFRGEAAILAAPLMDAGLCLALAGGLYLPFFESPWLKPLALPGKYCYGLYLLHMAVLYLGGTTWMTLFVRAGVCGSFVVYAFAATCAAALSYHAFELPANRDIRQRIGSA